MRFKKSIAIEGKEYKMSEVMCLIHQNSSETSIDCKANFIAFLWKQNDAIENVKALIFLWNSFNIKKCVKGSYSTLCNIEKVKEQTNLKIDLISKAIQHTDVIQLALENRGFLKTIYVLRNYLDLWRLFHQLNKEEEVILNIEMIQKAHADGDCSVEEIVTNQKKYQNWLFKELNGDTKMIMSCHRSIGFEYEFATYEAVKRIPSHRLISKSESFSDLFKVPFTLETDIYNELEIGIPPFLILNKDQKIYKERMSIIWVVFKKMMSHIATISKGKTISSLIENLQSKGLGKKWVNNLTDTEIKIVERKKHREKEYQIYSQLNISLNASEIGVFIISFGIKNYKSERYEYFKEVYTKLYGVFASNVKNQNEIIFAVHLCKGLSHILSIPSLLLLKKTPENNQNNRGVYSSVKEIFGLWIKDSIVNIADNSLTNAISREEMKYVILKLKDRIDEIMKEYIEKSFGIIKSLPMTNEIYKKIAFKEYEITLQKIISRLEVPFPVQKNNYFRELYKAENFPSNGEGVRKETFVNIYSPKKNHFHLAELRNDHQIQLFLSYEY